MRYELAQKRSVLLRCIIAFAVTVKFPIVACTYRTRGIKGSNCQRDVRVQESSNDRTGAQQPHVFVLRKALIRLILSTRACIAHCSRSSRRRGTVTRHRMHVTRLAAATRCRWRLQSRLQKGTAAGCISRAIPSGRRTRARSSPFVQGRFTQVRLGRRPSRRCRATRLKRASDESDESNR